MASPAASRASAAALAAARRAAARGLPPDRAAELAKEGLPRAIVLDTPAGLEQALDRELQLLGIPGRRTVTPGSIALEAPESSAWRAALECRLVKSVRLVVRAPFHAAYASTLQNNATAVDWRDYIWFGSEALKPRIKVRIEKSRLFHLGLVQERVTAAIEDCRQTFMKAKLQHAPDQHIYGLGRPSPPTPTVHVELRKDECQISVACTEEPHRRAYALAAEAAAAEAEEEFESAVPPEPPQGWVAEEDEVEESGDAGQIGDQSGSRDTPLGCVHAAACVMRSPLQRLLEDTAEESGSEQGDLVLWDPFCGTGTMLLEALGIVLGVPPGSPGMPLPFTAFPCFNEEHFDNVVKSLQMVPYVGAANLTLLGTHNDPHLIQAATSNLTGFRRAMPRPRFGEVRLGRPLIPCNVHFCEAEDPLEVAPELAGRPRLILTNVPYGDKSRGKNYTHRAYHSFGRMVRESAETGGLLGVYCLSAREDFKRLTGLDWRTELRFYNRGIMVELLRWTGRTADYPRISAPRAPKRSRAAAYAC